MSLELNDVLGPLVKGLEGIAVESAPVLLPVRCGIGGKTRRCGQLIGNVVNTPKGLAWVPAIRATSLPHPPGSVPLLLPSSQPKERQWFCEVLYSSCSKGHDWSLAATELKRRAHEKGRAPYFIERVVPTEWGPRVEDPAFWSDDELIAAAGAVYLVANKQWPPKGLTAVDRSKAEGRAGVMIDMLQETGPYLDRLPDVLERLRRAGIHRA